MNSSMRILHLKGQAHALVQRFPIAVCWQVVGFFVAAAIILLRPESTSPFGTADAALFDHLVHLMPALIGAWLTAAASRLLADAFPIKKSTLLGAAASAAVFLVLAYAWYGVETPSSHLLMGTCGVLLALLFLALFLLERANRALGLPALIFAAGFSLGTSILFFLGLTTCAAAFWALVVTDAASWTAETVYLFIGLTAYGLWGAGAFLGTLPQAGARYAFPAAAQKVLLYLLFPVYTLLLLVLYLYVGKIILAGEMPVGTMNWYASFALLAFAFFFGTHAEQNRLPIFTRFLKWGLLLFLPILAVQLYGVYLRCAAYAEEHDTFSLPKELQVYETGDYRLHFDAIYFTRAADGGINYFDTNGFALMC